MFFSEHELALGLLHLPGVSQSQSLAPPPSLVHKYSSSPKTQETKATVADTAVDPHDKMRSRDVYKVAHGLQAPRPPHEPGTIADAPSEPPPPDILSGTAPLDFCFPNMNQTRHCYARYVNYHRCGEAKGEEAAECEKFQKYYPSLCPTEWVVRWNEQTDLGIFPGPL